MCGFKEIQISALRLMVFLETVNHGFLGGLEAMVGQRWRPNPAMSACLAYQPLSCASLIAVYALKRSNVSG